MEKELLIYVDGKFYPKSQAKVSVYDHGLLYGDGVFEGIRAYNGYVFRLQDHIERLYRFARVLMLDIPLSKQEMIGAVIETLKHNNLQDSYIRLIVTRGVGDLGLDPRKCQKPTIIIITDEIRLHDGGSKEKGMRAMFVWVKRDPVDATSHEVKSLNYMNSIMAKIEANNSGCDEAICLDRSGHVSEGVAENIFVFKNGKIITPPTSTGALTGITRDIVLKLAPKLGYTILEMDITPTDVFTADEAFFTGTAAEIVPVVEVNKRIIGDGRPGPVTKRLMQEFQKIICDPKEGTPIYK